MAFHDSMSMHERERLVEGAELDLRGAWLEIVKKNGLTEGEELQILGKFVSSQLGHMSRCKIRMERHGNCDTPGGLSG
jgi:hypothetical protein